MYDLVYFIKREPDTSETSVTRVTRGRHKQHECGTSEIRATQVWHECYTNDTSATRVKNFGFDKGTCESIFSNLYVSYMANERLHREEQFHSKNYLFKMPRSHAKMRLKSVPQRLIFVMAKVIWKSYSLDYSCFWTFPHSYA